jgi:uncharacterized membrane protein
LKRERGLAESHAEKKDGGGAYSGKQRSSPRRLIVITIIMFGFAALSFLPSLFRGGTGFNTGYNITTIFIPVWLTLTISTVVISMWFTRYLMTAEKYRDAEAVSASGSEHAQ